MIISRSNTSTTMKEYVKFFNDTYADSNRVAQRNFALPLTCAEISDDEIQSVSSARLSDAPSVDGVKDIVRAVYEANKRIAGPQLTVSHAVRGNTGPVSRHHFGLAVDFQCPSLSTSRAIEHFQRVLQSLQEIGFMWNMAYIRRPSPAGIRRPLLHVDLHVGGESPGRRHFGGVKV